MRVATGYILSLVIKTSNKAPTYNKLVVFPVSSGGHEIESLAKDTFIGLFNNPFIAKSLQSELIVSEEILIRYNSFTFYI